jgi:hypothetical protein
MTQQHLESVQPIFSNAAIWLFDLPRLTRMYLAYETTSLSSAFPHGPLALESFHGPIVGS